jgi:3-oxoacyl-[acyl-carrier protein] reductase
VFVLTGAASGIGRHLTGALVRDGQIVVATDIHEEALRVAADADHWHDGQITIAPLDVRSGEAWDTRLQDVIEAHGQIDVLMNVAGWIRPGLIHEADNQQIDNHLDINTKGTILGTRTAAAHMVRQGQGHIINIASMAALAPIPGIGLYSASKFAVRGFSLAAAHELRQLGVYVTVVCPDAVQTPMLDLQVDYQEAALVFSGSRPLLVEEIQRAIFQRVLTRRPLEVIVPRRRGWLAKMASAMPGMNAPLLRRLHRRGLARQAAIKAACDKNPPPAS